MTAYNPDYARQAQKLCQLGATNLVLAEFFRVGTRTIDRWIAEREDFGAAVKIGKGIADEQVVRALYSRAIGYSHEDTDIKVVDGCIVETPIIKHYPPDTKACLAWLYNRLPNEWHPAPDGKDGGEAMAAIIKELIGKLPG